jgi:hypothetical protein
MNKIAVNEKIRNLEVQIQMLKISVVKEPDYSMDEKNWNKVKVSSKKARSKLFKTLYA